MSRAFKIFTDILGLVKLNSAFMLLLSSAVPGSNLGPGYRSGSSLAALTQSASEQQKSKEGEKLKDFENVKRNFKKINSSPRCSAALT